MQATIYNNNQPQEISGAFNQHLYSLALNRFHQPETNIQQISMTPDDAQTKFQAFTSTLPYPTAILSQFSA